MRANHLKLNINPKKLQLRMAALEHRQKALNDFKRQNYLEAIAEFEKSSSFIRNIPINTNRSTDDTLLQDNLRNLASAHNNLAMEKLQSNDLSAAHKNIILAIQYFKKLTHKTNTDILHLIQSYQNLSMILLMKQEQPEAHEIDEYAFLLLFSLKPNNQGKINEIFIQTLHDEYLQKILNYFIEEYLALHHEKKWTEAMEACNRGIAWIVDHGVLDKALSMQPKYFEYYCDMLIMHAHLQEQKGNYNSALITLNVGFQFTENKKFLAKMFFEISQSIARIYQHAANEFYRQGQLKEALHHFEMAKAFVLPDNNNALFDEIYRALAICYHKTINQQKGHAQDALIKKITSTLYAIKQKTQDDYKLLDQLNKS